MNNLKNQVNNLASRQPELFEINTAKLNTKSFGQQLPKNQYSKEDPQNTKVQPMTMLPWGEEFLGL